MKRITLVLAVVAWVSVLAADAHAQQVELGLAGSRSTHNEVTGNNRQAGFGGTGSAHYTAGGWGVEGHVTWQSLSPSEDGTRTSVTFLGGALRGHYLVWRSLAVEVGFESRAADPEFSAQDVATVGAGLRYETLLAGPATVWIRGGAIPLTWTNGGGDSGIGFDLGLGVRVRAADSKWGLMALYEFQRINRTVQSVDVPIQFERLRIGVLFAPF